MTEDDRPPVTDGAGPGEQAAYRQRRRVAGLRLLGVLLAGCTVQVIGYDAVTDPVTQAVLVVGPLLGYHAALGLLIPRPPGGFTRRRSGRPPAPSPRPPGCGVDLLDVVSNAAWFLPWQIVFLWLQGPYDNLLRATLVLVVLMAVGFMSEIGILEVRRRRQPARAL